MEILRSELVMLRDSIKTILVVLVVIAAGTATASGSPVPDGFSLMGVDGKLAGESKTDRWFFKFDADVSNRLGQIKAGTRFEILPSAALEKMVVNLQQHPDVSYRLWGKVTKHGGKNYIFADYFLPISEVSKPKPATTPGSQQEVEIKINEPNDELAMPAEIIAKLQSRKIIHFEQLSKGLKLEEDSILADRTGFILLGVQGKTQQEINKSRYGFFASDALGRNVGTIQIQLLPCEILERVQRQQAVEAEQVRFKVAGVVTMYKGQYYLLLQRAARAYNYGNF
ncbi:MAG: hypothetical protein MUO27_06315 [Sedimentisphaerales bacterium]|nr:hypothetical protein [Sedimentisphaerales bacterium]